MSVPTQTGRATLSVGVAPREHETVPAASWQHRGTSGRPRGARIRDRRASADLSPGGNAVRQASVAGVAEAGLQDDVGRFPEVLRQQAARGGRVARHGRIHPPAEGSDIQTTIWNEASSEAGLKAAMKLLIDDDALHCPGIKRIAQESSHAVHGADDATLHRLCGEF